MEHTVDRPPVIAVLGPTNTGKTHLAIERMLGHGTGMIGFPLRLLARENYDRIVRIKGRTRVALITGEEKIIPPNPAYFVCTVESMPLDRMVDFLAVDEIQLAADPERGHIFTARLLHARGSEETMFLGAETIRPLVRRLVPEAEHIYRQRFSNLTYAGRTKLTRLPPRSAIVSFSTTDVYHVAEMLRRQRGGTAVVLGALSPRTRNAQVEMYQSGDVDYLVATDAIGMGLNMDIDHVAFARLSKFDGQKPRGLTAQEIGQIAGRAGRHMSDGTFGTTGDCPAMDEEIIDRVETHDFPALNHLWWRNHHLDFRSPARLLRSLEARPPAPSLRRARHADDHRALETLIQDEMVTRQATTPAATRLLWEVCQIPDFRKMLSDGHTRMLTRIFLQLSDGNGRLEADWIATHLRRLDRTDGDIDALVTRIAYIRTWTYISHRSAWLEDPRSWQEQARALEDRLSDALHERLTQRFVDKRSTALAKSLKAGGELVGAVRASGEVLVEGEHVGMLHGLHFEADPSASPSDARALLAAARRVLRREMGRRVKALCAAEDSAITLSQDGRLAWDGAQVARLIPGDSPLTPQVAMLPGDLIDADGRDRAASRLKRWMDDHIAASLLPLMRLRSAALSGAARGIAFQLVEAFGSLPRESVETMLKAAGKDELAGLRKLGVKVGTKYVFLPALTRGNAIATRGLLYTIWHQRPLPPPLPRPGAQSLVLPDSSDAAFWRAIGFEPVGRHAVRIDRLEALWQALARLEQPFALPTDIAPLTGLSARDLPDVLLALGCRQETTPDGTTLWRRPRSRRRFRGRVHAADQISPDTPFAVLGTLRSSRA